MATTQNTFTGDGSNLGPFSFTFKWLEPTDIKVTVAGVLKTVGTHYNLQSLNYSTKTGGQVLFTAGNAPANGAAIVMYRQTDDTGLAAQFYSGSAIRSQDLNENFTQNLYVTQEANNNVITANATANSALTNSNTAISTANAATATANTASSNASAAVATANTANTNASNAVSTANTASSNATTAVNAANAATSTANSAAADAATAISTANAATSIANTASSNATTAVNTANSAASTANSAASTANTASSNATTAVNTANSALSAANSAVSTANSAISTANAAASAVASAILYDIVANVAAIPSSPANNDAVEVTNSTGIESFSPLSGLPSGYVGNSALSVRLVYTTTGSTWNWIQYFPNDPETRYLTKNGGALTGDLTLNAQSDLRFADSDSSNWVAFQGPATVGSNVTWTLPNTDGTNGQVLSTNGTGTLSWSTASAGVTDKIEEGNSSAEVIDTGSDGRFVVTTEGSERLRVDSSGRVGIGTTSPTFPLTVRTGASSGENPVLALLGGTGSGGSGPYITFGLTNFSPDPVSLQLAKISGTYEGGTYSGALKFYTNSGGDGASLPERMRIDSAGRLLVGTSSPRNLGLTCRTQIEGTTNATSALSITNNQASPEPSYLIFGKSRAGSLGGVTSAIADDYIGLIQFAGADGTDTNNIAAEIACRVDGTPGTNNMPGRLVFSTTADGASSPTERMRIDSSGRVGIGITSPGNALDVRFAGVASRFVATNGNNNQIGLSNAADGTPHFYIGAPGLDAFQFSNSAGIERARIDSSGRLLVGTSTTTSALKSHFSGTGWGGGTGSGTGSGTGIAQFVFDGVSLDNSGSVTPVGFKIIGGGGGTPRGFPFAAYGRYQESGESHMLFVRNTGNSYHASVNNVSIAGVFKGTADAYGSPAASSWWQYSLPSLFGLRDVSTNNYDGGSKVGQTIELGGAYSGGSPGSWGGICSAVKIATNFGTGSSGTNIGYYADITNAGSGNNWGLYIANGGAAKPGGGSFTATSDARVKNVSGAYSRGIDEILQLNPVRFTYNGKAKTPTDGTERVGLLAQEAALILPEIVATRLEKLNEEDERQTEILMVDPSDLVFTLINACKELQAQVSNLKDRVAALEAS